VQHRRIIAALAVAPLILGTTACSAGGAEGSDVKTLAFWDGFTQYDENSPFGKLISTCEDETGITIERTADAAVADNLLQAASGGNTPNLVILDNPTVAQFAETGLLVDNGSSGLDTEGQRENVLAAAQVGGKTYGGSLGSNTLALFYNTDMLAAAGVTPPTNWDELKAAVEATTQGDTKGIAFSATNTEEGTFQFLPFFWGAGADLDDIASPEAAQALQLWTDWIQQGQASESNINANQQDIRDQFLGGGAAMMVNGTWQLGALDEAEIPYAVVPIPAIDGGAAPSPLGGEFIEVVASDDAAEAASGEFAQCFINADNARQWTEGQNYISPYPDEADAQAQANPALQPWVDAVAAAKGRTANLGSDYPNVSKAIWTAVQESATGQKSPSDALEAAKTSVE
jgi:multiple sugar transport system substrate-binding protein